MSCETCDCKIDGQNYYLMGRDGSFDMKPVCKKCGKIAGKILSIASVNFTIVQPSDVSGHITIER